MQAIINSQKNPIHTIPKNVQTPITFSWILTLLFLGVTIIYFFLSQPELPLFYTVADKQDQLAPKAFLFLFPAISFAINIIHFIIVKTLQKFSAVLLRLFVETTIILQILLGSALVRIIWITI